MVILLTPSSFEIHTKIFLAPVKHVYLLLTITHKALWPGL